jgi:hypothetical protein
LVFPGNSVPLLVTTVIDGSHKLAALVSGAALERRPASVEHGPQAPQEPPSERRAPHSPSEVEAARMLMARHLRNEEGVDATAWTSSSLRSRRALDAYAVQQHGDERDYVARVLGIDEYV